MEWYLKKLLQLNQVGCSVTWMKWAFKLCLLSRYNGIQMNVNLPKISSHNKAVILAYCCIRPETGYVSETGPLSDRESSLRTTQGMEKHVERWREA